MYASIYIENSTYGVTSNGQGYYQMRLSPGTYQLVFSHIGNESKRRSVTIVGENVNLDVLLTTLNEELEEVEIVSNTKKKAKSLMQLVRENRRPLRDRLSSVSADFYAKITLDEDSLSLQEGAPPEIPDSLKKSLLLKEYFGVHHFERKGKFKQEIQAYRDY